MRFIPFFFFAWLVLITGCKKTKPCPLKNIPEKTSSKTNTKERQTFDAKLQLHLDAQYKIVESRGDLEAAFQDFAEMQELVVAENTFQHAEVRQYNMIVNQLCNVWNTIETGGLDKSNMDTCRVMYIDGLKKLQYLATKPDDSRSKYSLADLLLDADKEVAQLELAISSTQDANKIFDFESIIAKINHIKQEATRDSSALESFHDKLESIINANKNY